MGATKEWGIVLGLGGTVFLALMLLGPGEQESPTGDAMELLFPFPHARSQELRQVDLLGILRPPLGSQDPCPIEPREPTTWAAPRDGCYGAGVVVLTADLNPALFVRGTEVGLGKQRAHVDFFAPAPYLGVDGYNATRVTVHVFDAQGELVFSNGNASEQARLTRVLTPEQLPTGVWYLGANATAPPGTQKPPLAAQAFLPQVRHLIEGLPVGGVATTQTDALATWYGTLFVTLRVDELVHAP